MTEYKTFRFGTLNLMNNGPEIKDRYQLLRETLQSTHYDILAFQEVLEPELLSSILKEEGFTHILVSSEPEEFNSDFSNQLVIASRTPLKVYGNLDDLRKFPDWKILFAQTEIDGKIINIFTTHMFWGSFNEGKRLKVNENVESFAKVLENQFKGSITVYAGDFNAEPDARSIRYIKGKDLASDNTSSTFWTDAYDVAGSSDTFTTTDHAVNFYGRRTASNQNIKLLELIPIRRIDYIFVRGWVYGKVGCPVTFGYMEHPEGHTLSDHNGIHSDIILEFK